MSDFGVRQAIILTVCQALSSGSFCDLEDFIAKTRAAGTRWSHQSIPSADDRRSIPTILRGEGSRLQPLATSGLVTRISKYDTNYANHPQCRTAPASWATRPRERAECPLLRATFLLVSNSSIPGRLSLLARRSLSLRFFWCLARIGTYRIAPLLRCGRQAYLGRRELRLGFDLNQRGSAFRSEDAPQRKQAACYLKACRTSG